MSKKIIIALVIVTVVVGIIIIGYIKATPGLKNETAQRPQIEVSPKTYNFGEIEFGAIAKYTFKIKNAGPQTLEIKRIATSCACTSAKASKESINPNEEVDLLVTYDTKAMGEGPHGRGQQERIIYVRTNDPINPQVEVTINAYVK